MPSYVTVVALITITCQAQAVHQEAATSASLWRSVVVDVMDEQPAETGNKSTGHQGESWLDARVGPNGHLWLLGRECGLVRIENLRRWSIWPVWRDATFRTEGIAVADGSFAMVIGRRGAEAVAMLIDDAGNEKSVLTAVFPDTTTVFVDSALNSSGRGVIGGVQLEQWNGQRSLLYMTDNHGKDWVQMRVPVELEGELVMRVAVSSSGRIWAITDKAVLSVDSNKSRLLKYHKPDTVGLLALGEGKHGAIYVGGGWGQLIRYSHDGTSPTEVPVSVEMKDDFLSAIAIDESGRLWVGGARGKVYNAEDPQVGWKIEDLGVQETVDRLVIAKGAVIALTSSHVLLRTLP